MVAWDGSHATEVFSNHLPEVLGWLSVNLSH